jgi:hypothetical protein
MRGPLAKAFRLVKIRNGGRYRLVFDSALLSSLLQRDAEAFALALTKLKIDLNALGRPSFLDPENDEVFNAAVNANADGTWVSRFNGLSGHLCGINRCFTDGFLQSSSPDFESSFDLAAQFFKMLDREMMAQDRN